MMVHIAQLATIGCPLPFNDALWETMSPLVYKKKHKMANSLFGALYRE